jgi:hypothetical protein
VFKIREAKELPWSYFAARSLTEAVAMHLRSYRELPGLPDAKGWSR